MEFLFFSRSIQRRDKSALFFGEGFRVFGCGVAGSSLCFFNPFQHYNQRGVLLSYHFSVTARLLFERSLSLFFFFHGLSPSIVFLREGFGVGLRQLFQFLSCGLLT